MRWSWLLLVSLVLIAGCGGPQDSQVANDCVEAITVDGVVYARDGFNDARLRDEHLGQNVGEIDKTYDCGEQSRDGADVGISGSSGLRGDQVWTLDGHSSEFVLAVDTDWGIRLYRSAEVSPLEVVVEGDIEAIGINSDFDGETRFATIDDPATVEGLLARLVDAEPAERAGGDDLRYFVEFEHQGALVTVVPYFAATNQLGDRVVGDDWVAAIERALQASPEGEVIDGITLEGANGTGTFRPLGACRHDRVDLDVTPGELLTASTVDAAEAIWWLNPAETSPTPVPDSAQIGATVLVPNFEGAAILEVRLPDQDEGPAQAGCITVGSTGFAATGDQGDEQLPTGTIDCRDGARDEEPSAAEYTPEEAMTFAARAEAVAHWQNAPTRVESYGPSRLTALVSGFTPVVDLVSETGSVEASLLLSNNGAGWFVRTETLCPAPDASN